MKFMIDSTNPRQLADNIRKLWDKFKSISGDLLPSRSTATTGQILKLTGENKTPSWADEYSYTPPAYSETEVNTGQKWIDGKDIYCLVLSGITPETGVEMSLSGYSGINVIKFGGYIETISHGIETIQTRTPRISSAGTIGITLTSNYNGTAYAIIVYYTKPDPAPETRDDETPEEPEAKKTTKKKTTK